MTSVAPPVLTLSTPMRGARIVGIGAARPSKIVTAATLVAPFGKTVEWLHERTGIRQLARLAKGEDLAALAATASQRALADAGVDVADVDVILVATCSGSPVGGPALSAVLAEQLGARAVASDVNAACAGFCYALSSAGALVGSGSAQTVLVVGAEQMSVMIDPADLGTSILFADGAGAVVVQASEQGQFGIGPTAWSSDGENRGVLEIPDGETHLRMAGQQVFRWAVDEVHKVASSAITRAGLTAADIDVFVPHQANLRIVDAIRRKLRISDAVIATDVADSGNTSAASIPLALSRLRQGGQTRRGQLALLTGFGAGLSIAAQVVVLP